MLLCNLKMKEKEMNIAEKKVKITMTSSSWDELESCEYGSYEDHIAAEGQAHHLVASGTYVKGVDASDDGSRVSPYHDGRLHIVELIQRRGTKHSLELCGQQEIDEFFGAACTGTFGLYKLRVLQRIYRQLFPLVTEERRQFVHYRSLGF